MVTFDCSLIDRVAMRRRGLGVLGRKKESLLAGVLKTDGKDSRLSVFQGQKEREPGRVSKNTLSKDSGILEKL
jgi:hypothetical protein